MARINSPQGQDIQRIANMIGRRTPEEIKNLLIAEGYTDYGAYLAYKAAEVDNLMWERHPL